MGARVKRIAGAVLGMRADVGVFLFRATPSRNGSASISRVTFVCLGACLGVSCIGKSRVWAGVCETANTEKLQKSWTRSRYLPALSA